MPAGVQLFNSNGTVVFDSSTSTKYLRIMGRFVIPSAPSELRREGVFRDGRILDDGKNYFFTTNAFFDNSFGGYGPSSIFLQVLRNGEIYWSVMTTRQITVYYGRL